MANEEKKLLNDETLERVSGGLLKASDEFSIRKNQFETAWGMLGLNSKDISCMKMAEVFDEWELTGFKLDAVSFLQSQNL